MEEVDEDDVKKRWKRDDERRVGKVIMVDVMMKMMMKMRMKTMVKTLMEVDDNDGHCSDEAASV
jgi:hypothetical protein